MNLLAKIVFASLACFLAYGVGLEVKDAPPAVQVPPGVTLVGFGDLAAARLPEAGAQVRRGDYLKALPRSIRDLDSQRVLIQGFMIPTVTENHQVKDFLLVRNQASCCFGFPLRVSEVLDVRMASGPAQPLMDRVVNVVGQLHIQEHWAGPFLGSLYQMEADSVTTGSAQPSSPLASPSQPRGLE
ncbi:MAG: DUF3299 domain-containing protein [Holophaga sp.]|nr:DUF3299 domain-containing protein [Holophaga sp.]